MIFWLIFSILGVNLFGGRFGRCVNIQTKRILPSRCPSPTGCDGKNQWLTYSQNRKRCMQIRDYYLKTQNRTVVDWKVPEVNFDNVWNGYLALLQVATFMGWLEIMHNAVDIRGEDLQPEYEATMWSYVYFIIFIVCGSFFCLNLFIGVIIDNFNQQKVKKKSNGFDDGVFLTDEQRQYYDAMRKMAAKTPKKPIPRPKNRFAAAVYNLVTDRRFELAVMVAILLNMVVMAIESHDANDNILFILEQLNNVFVGIFGAEVILKLIGLRQHYFTVPWNVFDLVVVVVSVVASALSDLISHFVQPTIFRIVRLFRVTRVLRLIREAKVIHNYFSHTIRKKVGCVFSIVTVSMVPRVEFGPNYHPEDAPPLLTAYFHVIFQGIRTLLFALMMSLPALFNIGSLLILVMFMYAILGMSQFAYVQKVGGIDDMLNFETFPNSFLLLFQGNFII